MRTILLRRAIPLAILTLAALSCAGGPAAPEEKNLLYRPGNTVLKHQGGGTVLAPNFALSYYNNGIERYAVGSLGDAEDYFTKAVTRMKGYEKSYGGFYSLLRYRRGLARGRNGETDGALEDYNAAVAADRRNYLALYARGSLHRSMNRPGDAIADLTRAIALKPGYAPAYYQRGVAYAASRRGYGSAIRDLKRALALSPAYQAPLYHLARVYSLSGNGQMALRYLDQAAARAVKSEEGARNLLEALRSSAEDFKAISGSPQFGALTEQLEKGAE